MSLEQLFQEVNKYSQPTFDFLPEVEYYNMEFEKVERGFEFVKLIDSEHSKFLKKIIPHEIKEEQTYFKFNELREFFQSLNKKSFI